MKVRYCITHVNVHGHRVLTLPKQARHTFDTREEAQAWLDAARPDLCRKMLGHLARTLEVKPFMCFNHGDPISSFYQGDDGEPYVLRVGDIVKRGDVCEDDIPAFKQMTGRVVAVSGAYSARVHWQGDAEPEHGTRPTWQLEKVTT